MIRPDVTELFIYYRDPSRAFEVMADGGLFFAKASSFNDPFDCDIPFVTDYDPVKYAAAILRKGIEKKQDWKEIQRRMDVDMQPDASLSADAKRRINENAEKFLAENRNMGVLCLTEDPRSVLMWSHYGDKHQGICLGLKRDPGNELGDEDACAPVIYTDVYPEPSFTDILDGSGNLTKALLYTKAREWAYEKEWRALIDDGGRKIMQPDLLSSIIVGCNTPTTTIEQCRAESIRLGVPLSQACKVAGKFALSIEKI